MSRATNSRSPMTRVDKDNLSALATYTLSPRGRESREQLLKYLILRTALQHKGDQEARLLSRIRGQIHNRYGLGMTNFEFGEITRDLIDEGLATLSPREAITPTPEGEDYCQSRMTASSDLQRRMREWVYVQFRRTAREQSGTDVGSEFDEAIWRAFTDLVNRIVQRDASLLLRLFQHPGPSNGTEDASGSEQDGLGVPPLQTLPLDLQPAFRSFEAKIQRSVLGMTEPLLNEFLVRNAYAKVLEFLLMKSVVTRDPALENFFQITKSQMGFQTLLLDSNVLIAAVSHFDRAHNRVQSILRLLADNNHSLMYLDITGREIRAALKSMGRKVDIIDRMRPIDRQKLLSTGEFEQYFDEGPRSPVISYFLEGAYRNWDHYTADFFRVLKNVVDRYGIVLAQLERFAPGTTQRVLSILPQILGPKQLLEKVDIYKEPLVLQHDVALLLCVDSYRELTSEKAGFLLSAWSWTLDRGINAVEKLLAEMKATERRNLAFSEIRSLAAYLCPLESRLVAELQGDDLEYYELAEQLALMTAKELIVEVEQRRARLPGRAVGPTLTLPQAREQLERAIQAEKEVRTARTVFDQEVE